MAGAQAGGTGVRDQGGPIVQNVPAAARPAPGPAGPPPGPARGRSGAIAILLGSAASLL